MTEIVAATKVHQSWPEWLMELRRQANTDFPEDIEKAVTWLLEQAEALIHEVVKGREKSEIEEIIRASWIGIQSLPDVEAIHKKEMEELAIRLPIYPWIKSPEQDGIATLSVATVVGECGNLHNYSGPAKVWRRMACAPYTYEGHTHMGETWKKEGLRKINGIPKLSNEAWEDYGYSPKRRSLMYVIGGNILKQNGDGPYRKEYDREKERTKNTHPEWWACHACESTGKTRKGSNCSSCKGTGQLAIHAHKHAMLLASKLFLKYLWVEWKRCC